MSHKRSLEDLFKSQSRKDAWQFPLIRAVHASTVRIVEQEFEKARALLVEHGELIKLASSRRQITVEEEAQLFELQQLLQDKACMAAHRSVERYTRSIMRRMKINDTSVASNYLAWLFEDLLGAGLDSIFDGPVRQIGAKLVNGPFCCSADESDEDCGPDLAEVPLDAVFDGLY